MVVYWTILAWTTFVGLTWKKWFIVRRKTLPGGRVEMLPTVFSLMIAMIPLIFIIGMRTEIADTSVYIS